MTSPSSTIPATFIRNLRRILAFIRQRHRADNELILRLMRERDDLKNRLQAKQRTLDALGYGQAILYDMHHLLELRIQVDMKEARHQPKIVELATARLVADIQQKLRGR